ncbi:hypothetical protein C6S32_13370 [Listeria monocytogenes]|uniref:Uncharacterized protein n=1 Tax=Listeria monocytogenes TaxID=1639 RepID=A0A2Z5C5B0_LISMN|nr:hypothetical protein B0X32_13360 [Listeria monocytogenes]EAC6520051.1 hypothetical protein [Listeria monocytogenes serotype 4b]EAE1679704.1 hypothetical protein [Listeria monocytogenes LIS0071]EAE3710169.1 hypothetical protein [Listeria monocytogenes serotype 1/2b]EAF3077450.1 hypothetical protein [Listeria monocytogenes serotype 1/2a]EAG6252373.1 hypothetical protein [Listeria monocytogenes CFSAN003806]EAG6261722.1 hypothetical protein [Listeria monocytogenes CFSAN003725]EAL09273.1 hypot
MRTALVFLRFGRTSSWNCHIARLLISYTCIIVTLITRNINLTNRLNSSPIHSKDDAVLLLALPLS